VAVGCRHDRVGEVRLNGSLERDTSTAHIRVGVTVVALETSNTVSNGVIDLGGGCLWRHENPGS
jgi:hypothetical protein